MNKAPHMPVYPHHPHRTWITPKGKVVSMSKKAERDVDDTKHLSFEAKVIDSGTEEPIDSFPIIKADASIQKNVSHQHQIEEIYYDRLRWMDGDKPDIEQLKKNVNAGIWEIEVAYVDGKAETTPELTTTNH